MGRGRRDGEWHRTIRNEVADVRRQEWFEFGWASVGKDWRAGVCSGVADKECRGEAEPVSASSGDADMVGSARAP